ncbi:hypothetical protein Tco_0033690 [Tanacetum coccineum]|uniref:Reverse transcriptase domain-containing protein n=1 Tax=Tanacetum coccineum TaxID=301880 RepID=A0ABQ5HW70_9ASTR
MDTGSTSTDNLIEKPTKTLALLKKSSNARNKATVQDDRVVVQDVRDRYNVNNQGRPFQRNNARENVVAGNVGGQKQIMDEEQLLFLEENMFTNFDDDVDDLALNVDHVFEADQLTRDCKAMYNSTTVVDLMRDFTSDSNIIPYDQYVGRQQPPRIFEHPIQEKDNVIRHLKDRVANVNDRSRVPYNAIDVTALVEQNDCYRVELEKIESLKAQLRSKEPCFTSDYVKPKVLAPGMYAIDVKPIPHPLKNNRGAHLNYVKHLKESVEKRLGRL